MPHKDTSIGYLLLLIKKFEQFGLGYSKTSGEGCTDETYIIFGGFKKFGSGYSRTSSKGCSDEKNIIFRSLNSLVQDTAGLVGKNVQMKQI